MLELIQGKARWGAKEVARELECSERTVYRDLQVLGMAGVPWYFDEAGKCYRVRDHFRFPVVALSNDELIGQAVATAIASSDGFNAGGGAKPTTRKLLASSSTEAAKLLQDASRLIQVLGLKLADHSQHQEMIG
ncbi:MAG TPA: HTH domain-containing protein, partial [Pirellulales bacterium]|nr:HTH domain-containing protein [Pirellulales bacterium]